MKSKGFHLQGQLFAFFLICCSVSSFLCAGISQTKNRDLIEAVAIHLLHEIEDSEIDEKAFFLKGMEEADLADVNPEKYSHEMGALYFQYNRSDTDCIRGKDLFLTIEFVIKNSALDSGLSNAT